MQEDPAKSDTKIRRVEEVDRGAGARTSKKRGEDQITHTGPKSDDVASLAMVSSLIITWKMGGFFSPSNIDSLGVSGA